MSVGDKWWLWPGTRLCSLAWIQPRNKSTLKQKGLRKLPVKSDQVCKGPNSPCHTAGTQWRWFLLSPLSLPLLQGIAPSSPCSQPASVLPPVLITGLFFLLEPLAPLVQELCPVPQLGYLPTSQTLNNWGLHALLFLVTLQRTSIPSHLVAGACSNNAYGLFACCFRYCLLWSFLCPTWVMQLDNKYRFIPVYWLPRILCGKEVQGLV